MIDRHPARLPRVFAVLIGIVGLLNLVGGLWLAVLGGSLFYAVAGAAMLVAAMLLWRRRVVAIQTVALLSGETIDRHVAAIR